MQPLKPLTKAQARESLFRGAEPLASAAQCRAARAILQWSQGQLAKEAGVARKTIADFEADQRPLKRRTCVAITAALRLAGVEFIADGHQEGLNLQVRREPLRTPTGQADRGVRRSMPTD